MSTTIELPNEKPSKHELETLERRCRAAIEKLKSDDSEVRLPVFVEFAGSPKSGKSTIIGIIAHFLRRQGITVARPAEGASLRTPEPLKDDWLPFNAWSGCYALQNILVDCFLDPPADVVLLDRGLFDIAAWMEFLNKSERRITDDDQKTIEEFFRLDFWRRRINAVFVFTANHETSMARENDSKLTSKLGSMMNAEKLGNLLDAYSSSVKRLSSAFPQVFEIDTSYRKTWHPDFQTVAYKVGDRIVSVLDQLGTQELLVTASPNFEGLRTDDAFVGQMCKQILQNGSPKFLERANAEQSMQDVQVVPYALIRNADGKYFMAKRRADLKRKELRAKLTILAGGHAERRDFDPAQPARVFETCLRRELEEEFVGIRIESINPVGFLYDPHSQVGTLHMAFVHEAEIGGRMAIRRQALDKEFGREAVEWVDEVTIKTRADDLDPWSQIVAHKRFGAPLPPSGQLFPRASE